LQLNYQFMKSKIIIVSVFCLFWSACSAEPAKNTNNQNANKQSIAINTAQTNKNANAAADDKLVLSDTSQIATFPCNGREVEIEEYATTSNYTFTGECKKLIVDGVSNQVTVEKVGEIVVRGISNKVIYGEGIGGKKPKITRDGESLIVQSQAEKDKADARKK
jgi:hypothetical protein